MNKEINILVNERINNTLVINFLKKTFNVNVINFNEQSNIKNIDLILFNGGEDVYPKFYKEQNVGKFTSYNVERDNYEYKMYNYYPNTPKLGICRGAQFLTAMNGGKIIQHVINHSKDHYIKLNNKYKKGIIREFNDILSTSTHHQMMYPYNLNNLSYDIIAYSKYYLSDTYLNGYNENKILDKNFKECEIVYYKDSKSLCIQGHPEFESASYEFKILTLELINNILLK